jgi:hypothetical protein
MLPHNVGGKKTPQAPWERKNTEEKQKDADASLQQLKNRRVVLLRFLR